MKKHFLALIVLSTLASIAMAAVVSITWENATTNTDGSAIPATGPGSLTGTIVEYGPCNAARDAITGTPTTITTTAPATRPVTNPDLGPGTWCARARHANTYGSVSAWTPMGVRVVEAPVPNPPQNFSFGS